MSSTQPQCPECIPIWIRQEFVFFRIHANKKIEKILSADQTSIPGVNQLFSPSTFLNGIWFLFCYRKFSVRLKLLIVVENSSSHSFQENAEHIRWTVFHWCCEEVEMRGTCLEAQKSIQTKVVINSWKLYYDTEDTITRCRTKGLSDIRRNKKFTIDVVPKSVLKTHLTVEPILKQCAVYGSRPPIASKSGSVLSGTIRSNNITNQSEETCPRTTSDST